MLPTLAFLPRLVPLADDGTDFVLPLLAPAQAFAFPFRHLLPHGVAFEATPGNLKRIQLERTTRGEQQALAIASDQPAPMLNQTPDAA